MQTPSRKCTPVAPPHELVSPVTPATGELSAPAPAAKKMKKMKKALVTAVIKKEGGNIFLRRAGLPNPIRDVNTRRLFACGEIAELLRCNDAPGGAGASTMAARDREISDMAARNYRTPSISARAAPDSKVGPPRPELSPERGRPRAMPALFLPVPWGAAVARKIPDWEDSALAYLERTGIYSTEECAVLAASACEAAATTTAIWVWTKTNTTLTKALAGARERLAGREIEGFIADQDAARALAHYDVAQKIWKEYYAPKPKKAALPKTPLARSQRRRYEAWMWQQRILAKEDLLGMERASGEALARRVSAELAVSRANDALAHHRKLGPSDTALGETRHNIDRTETFGKRKRGIMNNI
jgi:hypothetical protein